VRSGTAERAVALVRLAAIPVVLAGERMVAHPDVGGDLFDWLLAFAALYAAAVLLTTFTRQAERVPRLLYPVLDLTLLLALTYTSGGAFSQLGLAFFVLPAAAAFLMSPAGTALWSAISVAGYLGISLTHPATDRSEDLSLVLTHALYLAWVGLAAVLLAVVLTQRGRRVEELAAARGRLVAQAIGAEERERKGLAEALHDGAVQDLLAVGQDLDEVERGDRAALVRAHDGVRRSTAQLRQTISELHPYVLEHAGLEAALHSLIERWRRDGTRWTLEVDPNVAGVADRLLLSIARELISNAARHSGAAEIIVSARVAASALILDVADDGRGIDRDQARTALAQGHLGLATSAERVEAAGGRLELLDRPGGGTIARATLPLGLIDGSSLSGTVAPP
jgi:two-component system, NarL family, sensor kinase